MPSPTDRFGRRPLRPLTPKLRAQIFDLRSKAPWLALRKIATALGLSLWQVRQAITEPAPPHRIRRRFKDGELLPKEAGDGLTRCATCGARLTTGVCLRCSLETRRRRA